LAEHRPASHGSVGSSGTFWASRRFEAPVRPPSEKPTMTVPSAMTERRSAATLQPPCQRWGARQRADLSARTRFFRLRSGSTVALSAAGPGRT
jgi:hypothetical protein